MIATFFTQLIKIKSVSFVLPTVQVYMCLPITDSVQVLVACGSCVGGDDKDTEHQLGEQAQFVR
jgi:hypothetical protein